MRAYVEAQNDYASEDRDDDGVEEFAQKLVSSEGATDGLYWPADQGSTAKARRATSSTRRSSRTPAKGEGYFGYRFRILTGQGDRIAGGAYDYVINGNMIAGFALDCLAGQICRDRREHFRSSTSTASSIRPISARPPMPSSNTSTASIPDDGWAVVND